MIDIDTYYKVVTFVLTGLLGLSVGSFLNVVIYRVPEGMSLAKPPSHCPNCNYVLRWYDNIPILSYIILRGKCRGCGQPISPRYMMTEIGNMALWLLCMWRFYDEGLVYAIICCAASSVCVVIFFIDIEHMLIFDRFQIIFGALAIASFFFDKYSGIIDRIIGGAAGFLSFFLISLAVSKATKKDAMGGGDIKLALVMGLFLGWQRFLLMSLIASLTASIILIILSKKHNDEKHKEYPFAPFLCVGFTVAMLFGSNIINWYISLLNIS